MNCKFKRYEVGEKMRAKNKRFLILSGLFFVLFLGVVLITSGNAGFLMDESVGYWADQNDAAWLHKLMEIASVIGSSEMILVITVLIGLVLLIRRSWRHFFFFFVVSVGGVALNLGLKMLVQRARPGDEMKFIEVFGFSFELQSYSFPSGHTMRATILFLFLIYLSIYALKSASVKVVSTIIYLALLVSVALSRVMLEAHYVTDVLGGVVASVGWFFLCLYFFYRPKDSGYSFYINR